MRRFNAKTVEEAIVKACEELNVTAEELNYTVIEEKKGLFTKKPNNNMGEETSNTQAPKARDCGYLWDEAEAWAHEK